MTRNRKKSSLITKQTLSQAFNAESKQSAVVVNCSGPPFFFHSDSRSSFISLVKSCQQESAPDTRLDNHIGEGCRLVYFHLLTSNRADLGAVTFAFRQTGRRACRAANSCHLSSSLIYENLCI